MGKIDIVITGGDGYIGSNLNQYFSSQNKSVHLTTIIGESSSNQTKLDLTDREKTINFFNDFDGDIIFHTAGLSSLAECEKNPPLAHKINFEATKNIVDAVKDKKTKLIFFSSEYVFDGERGNYRENSPTYPKTIYGKTKAEAENYIKSNLNNFIIIRTANVFGRGGNFYNFIYNSLLENKPVEVFHNVLYTPTYIDFLLNSLDKLIEIDFRGLIHLTGKETTSRYEFARKMAELMGKNQRLIKKTTLPVDGLIAKNSSLNTNLLKKTINNYNPDLKNALKHALGHTYWPHFYHHDNRGKIHGILQNKNIQEVNFLASKKDNIRGNHFHKKTDEYFYIISGEVEVKIKNILDNTQREFLAEKGDIFLIKPYELHTFVIVKNASWINFLSQPMTNNDFYTEEKINNENK